MDLQTLFNSKQYRKGNGVTFPSIEEVVTPWLNNIDEHIEEYDIRVEKVNEVAVDVDQETGFEQEHIVYKRFILEGLLKPEYQFEILNNDRHNLCIGMLGYFDTLKPSVKVYAGYMRHSCLNLSIFSPRKIITQEFSNENFDLIYEQSKRFIPELVTERREFEYRMEEMASVYYSGDDLALLLGRLGIEVIKKGNLTTAYTNMIKMLVSNRDISNDIKNTYYKQDRRYNKFDIYNAFTNTISSKKDSVNRAEHSYAAFKLFENV